MLRIAATKGPAVPWNVRHEGGKKTPQRTLTLPNATQKNWCLRHRINSAHVRKTSAGPTTLKREGLVTERLFFLSHVVGTFDLPLSTREGMDGDLLESKGDLRASCTEIAAHLPVADH